MEGADFQRLPIFSNFQFPNFDFSSRMRKVMFFALLASLCGSCEWIKKAGKGGCDVNGVVRNFEGLDGCGLLVELENGDKLNPVSVKEDFQLQDGQRIKFSYRVHKGMMSICMSEKAMVDITCIRLLAPGETETTDCADTNNPFAVPWMDRAFDRHNPTQIFKYRQNGTWAYLFYGIPDSFLYDCRGNLLCQTHGDEFDECHVNYLKKYWKGKLIWQGEGVWD